MSDYLEAFLHHTHRRKVARKQRILEPTSSGDTLYYLVEGSAAAVIEGEEGQELILDYINAGDFIGTVGFFVETTSHEAIVVARTPCVVAAITYDALRQLGRKELAHIYPDLLTLLATQLSTRLLKTSRKAGALAHSQVSGRIAAALLELTQRPDAVQSEEGVSVHITRVELGQVAGCTREVVGRTLKSMEQDGHIALDGKNILLTHDFIRTIPEQ